MKSEAGTLFTNQLILQTFTVLKEHNHSVNFLFKSKSFTTNFLKNTKNSPLERRTYIVCCR